MPYRLPTFNLLANIWLCNNVPNDGDPVYEDVPCQKYIQSRPPNDVTPSYQNDYQVEWYPAVVLRFPRDVLPYSLERRQWDGGFFECPAGSQHYYRAFFEEVAHEGFPNEYAMVIVTQCDRFGLAWSPPSIGAPTGIGDSPCS